MILQKTCIIDIDGVLNYYPQTYVDYVNSELNANFNDLNEIKAELSYTMYRNIKKGYRTTGYKENLDVREGARELLYYLKSKGYYIIILTARPIDEYNSLLQQTTNWLKKNNLVYDYLTFYKDKDLEILKKFKNIDFVIEDNRANANKISKQGYETFLVNNRYNNGDLEGKVTRVNELAEIKQYI